MHQPQKRHRLFSNKAKHYKAANVALVKKSVSLPDP